MKALAALGLGSKHWNIKATLAALPDECAIQVFDDYPGLFGDPRDNLNILCKTGKVKTVEVMLCYTKPHTLVPIDWMNKRLPIWEKWALAHPNVTVFINHTTEHYEKDKEKLTLRMELIKHFNLIPVNNPEPGKGVILPGYINETHKPKKIPGQYVASMDGFDTLVKGNVLAWDREHRQAAYNYAWSALCNLNDGKQGTKPPAQRTAAPSTKHLKMLFHISECPPPPPKEAVLPFPNKWLWKPVRETTNDSRDNKPCLICKIKKDDGIMIRDTVGHKIGRLPYYGPYYNKADPSKNGFRYYAGSPGGCGLWGYEMAEAAIALSGSPWCHIVVPEKEWLVHPAFRFGYFT